MFRSERIVWQAVASVLSSDETSRCPCSSDDIEFLMRSPSP